MTNNISRFRDGATTEYGAALMSVATRFRNGEMFLGDFHKEIERIGLEFRLRADIFLADLDNAFAILDGRAAAWAKKMDKALADVGDVRRRAEVATLEKMLTEEKTVDA